MSRITDAGPPVLRSLVEQVQAMQRRGVPREQIRRALGLSEALAQDFGLGRAAPIPDPYGSDPRARTVVEPAKPSRATWRRRRGRRRGRSGHAPGERR